MRQALIESAASHWTFQSVGLKCPFRGGTWNHFSPAKRPFSAFLQLRCNPSAELMRGRSRKHLFIRTAHFMAPDAHAALYSQIYQHQGVHRLDPPTALHL